MRSARGRRTATRRAVVAFSDGLVVTVATVVAVAGLARLIFTEAVPVDPFVPDPPPNIGPAPITYLPTLLRSVLQDGGFAIKSAWDLFSTHWSFFDTSPDLLTDVLRPIRQAERVELAIKTASIAYNTAVNTASVLEFYIRTIEHGLSDSIDSLITLFLTKADDLDARITADEALIEGALGELGAKIDALQRLTPPDPGGLVENLKGWSIDNIFNPLNGKITDLAAYVVGPFAAAIGSRIDGLAQTVAQDAARADQCCAANTNFRNEYQDLLSKLKPLLTALKVLDVASLALLAEHLFAEGAPAFAVEVAHAVESHADGVITDLTGFLGL